MSGSFGPPPVVSGGTGGTTAWATPGAIGSTTPNAGTFTSLTQTGPLVTTVGTTQTIAANTTITANAPIVAISSANPITMIATQQIGTGSSGQRLTLINVGTNKITLVNGNGLVLPQNIVLAGGRSLSLIYSTAYTSWIYAETLIESLALTGTPTAPTATAGNATTQIATTAFVDAPGPLWTAFTFQNSFADYTAIGSTFQTCRYTKSRGVVYLQGLATRSISGFTNGMIITTLPAGHRPPATLRFPGGDSYFSPTSVIDIEANGNVVLLTAGSFTTIVPSFNHISFWAA